MDSRASAGCRGRSAAMASARVIGVAAPTGELDGACVEVDFVANAASMGARAVKAETRAQIEAALADARAREGVQVIVVPVDGDQHVGGYESWWDVPVAEVSPIDNVQRARKEYRERTAPSAPPVLVSSSCSSFLRDLRALIVLTSYVQSASSRKCAVLLGRAGIQLGR